MMKDWESIIAQALTVNEVLKIKESLLDSDYFVKLIAQVKKGDPETKKSSGQELNKAKQEVQSLVDARIHQIQDEQLKDSYLSYDPTLPIVTTTYPPGSTHPITQTIQKVVKVFSRMGFDVYDGAQILSQWDNFDSVNVPEYHPARDLQDTFYLDAHDPEGRKYLLRTQATSNFAAYAREHQPPFRVLFPSITFRNETIDATHEVNFHQFDMWLVDKEIALSDLIGLMNYFFQEFFASSDIKVRLRPSFYPFVQPGFDTDIFVPWLKGGVWLEVAGSGPIHEKVLAMNGIDPTIWSGMAWGFGLDRLFMIEHNLNFISQMYTGNLQFLEGKKLS